VSRLFSVPSLVLALRKDAIAFDSLVLGTYTQSLGVHGVPKTGGTNTLTSIVNLPERTGA
jgi:hypothetical protein